VAIAKGAMKMIHQLLVGHFDVSVRSFRPKVIKSIEVDRVQAILAAYCDKEGDGTPRMAQTVEQATGKAGAWLGRIGGEDVHLKGGYLVCPWFSAGINQISIRFICDLRELLGVQIYGPDDGRFFTGVELALEEAKLPAATSVKKKLET
jgi:hypothetical protein